MLVTISSRSYLRALAAAGFAALLAGCAGEAWPTLAAPEPAPAVAAPAPLVAPAPRPAAAALPADEAAALRARLPGLVDEFAARVLRAEEAYAQARADAMRSGEGGDRRAAEMALSRLGRVESEIAAERRALGGLLAASPPGERAEVSAVAARLADMHEILSARLADERRALAAIPPPA